MADGSEPTARAARWFWPAVALLVGSVVGAVLVVAILALTLPATGASR